MIFSHILTQNIIVIYKEKKNQTRENNLFVHTELIIKKRYKKMVKNNSCVDFNSPKKASLAFKSHAKL